MAVKAIRDTEDKNSNFQLNGTNGTNAQMSQCVIKSQDLPGLVLENLPSCTF